MNKFWTLTICIWFNCLTSEAGVPFLFQNSTGMTQSVKWPNTVINIEINPSTSTSLSNAEVLSELNTAMDQWQNIQESSITFNRVTTFDSPTNFGPTVDFKNTITFVGNTGFPPGVIGITFVTADADSREIVDVDMQFNQGQFTFITNANGPSNVNQSRIVLSSVATHEFGHLLGFDHSPQSQQNIDIFNLPESTMYPFFSDDQLSLEQDDISILAFNYPSPSNTYKHVIEGKITSGDFFPDDVTGAHVIAWDRIGNPNVSISTISGITSTGVNLNGNYRIEGLPPGNYTIYIEPFPIQNNNNQVTLEENFGFLDQVSAGTRATFLLKNRNFTPEFYNGTAESQFEIDSGISNASTVLIADTTGNRTQQIDMITNLTNQDLDLVNSFLVVDDSILYANGNTKTLVKFQPRDIFNNQINTDLSSRIEFTISTGSFSSSSIQSIATPTLINDGSFTYFSEVFSPILSGDKSLLVANLSVKFDDANIPNKQQDIRFEKSSTNLTDISFIPDINKFNNDGLPQTSRPIFANGLAPATFQLIPKFSDGSTIEVSLPLDWPISGISAEPMENTITTFPLNSVGNNTYQITMTNSLPGLVSPVFYVDGVKIAFPSSISFNNVSTNSRLTIDADRIHIKHPDVPQTPKAIVSITPTFSDGSIISSEIPTDQFNLTISRLDGSPAIDVIRSPVIGPLYDDNDNPYYQVEIEATSTIETVNIELEIAGRPMSQNLNLSFDIPDPAKCEIITTRQYMLRGSNQTQEIQIIPRFSDNSIVGSDLSKLIFLSTSDGVLSNEQGEFTSTLNPAINPSLKQSGLLTATYTPGTVEGLSFILGTIQAAGFQQISQQGQINIVDVNPNLLRINLLDNSIPADATSITTLIVTPLFPDNTPVGKEFNADLLTASITSGEFLKKAPSIINVNEYSLFPAGSSNVSFFNQNIEDSSINGGYELSIRSSNFSTIARINFFVNNTLSLTSEEISFNLLGSADPIRTNIIISKPIIYSDGRSTSKIDIFPKSSNGQGIDLPTTSSVIIQSNYGLLIGAITKNLDNSYSQYLQSDINSVNKTASITVIIDGIQMTPVDEKTVKFIDLNVNNLVNNLIYPDNNLIDGFDVAILAKAIRDRVCENNQGDCTLDFDNDGNVDLTDLEILKTAYGSITND
tara:strand:- start:336 stop:3791 length:3456 start_codon:yes stop_codon:yes gene_type:complete